MSDLSKNPWKLWFSRTKRQPLSKLTREPIFYVNSFISFTLINNRMTFKKISATFFSKSNFSQHYRYFNSCLLCKQRSPSLNILVISSDFWSIFTVAIHILSEPGKITSQMTTTTRGALNTLQTILLSHEKHDFCTSMSRIHWKIVNCHSSLALFTSDATNIWGFCCHSSHQHVSLLRHVINFYDDEIEMNPQAMDIQTRLIMHDQIPPSPTPEILFSRMKESVV